MSRSDEAIERSRNSASESSGPLVSIVIPSRGGATRLPRLFKALAAQTYPNWEAIVVLDGDVDDSNRVCLAAGVSGPVRVVLFPENRGRTAALNAGFEAARGDILVRCDDDLEPAPEYVEHQVALHSQHGPVGLVGLYRNIFPDTDYARVYGRPRDARFRRDAYDTSPDQHWHYWAGNVSISRATYERVGEYDPLFRAYGYEDVDMGYRIHQAGVPIVLARELEAPHFVAATTTRIRVKRAFYSGSARKNFLAKHALPIPKRPGGAWGLAIRVVSAGGFRSLDAFAGAVDRALRVLPSWVGEKLIALLVEAAADAGLRDDGQRDLKF